MIVFHTAQILLKLFLYKWDNLVKCILCVKDTMFGVCLFFSDFCKYVTDFILLCPFKLTAICRDFFFFFKILSKFDQINEISKYDPFCYFFPVRCKLLDEFFCFVKCFKNVIWLSHLTWDKN